MTNNGTFHDALFYRLNVIPMRIPPLRERRGDIPLLVEQFICKYTSIYGRTVRIEPAAQVLLAAYSYPGNVRELENEARRLLALTPPGLPLSTDRLSRRISDAVADHIDPVRATAKEKERLELHLRLAEGNRTHAAKSLGISRETLRKKMKQFGLTYGPRAKRRWYLGE